MRRPIAGHHVFFPAALAFAALMVPAWAASHAGLLPLGWNAAIHAHEMVAGYALAVVGGFLMTRPSRRVLAAALLAWLAGRAAMLLGAPPALAIPATLAYPALLFAVTGLPFLRTAKSGHNAVFGPLIGAFVLMEGLFWLDAQRGATLALALVGMLLLAMGGRVIPAATAGALRDKGGVLDRRVRPRLEWASLAGAATATLSVAAGLGPGPGEAGALVAGSCALLRLAGWRTAAVLDRPEVWTLHLGYLLAALGWIAVGAEPLLDLPGQAEWHVLAIGGLGVLANAMMVRATFQREGLPVVFPAAATAAACLLAMAVPLRLLPLPEASAVAWTLAHILTATVLLTAVKGSPRRRG